jgi:hypothetical protein
MVVGQALGRTLEKAGAMTSDTTVPIKRSSVRAFLVAVANGCGGLLNSILVALGDKLGLYKTGQYSFDLEEPPAGNRRS